ncbi:hypothetical protein M378DRAFT_162086 [Amanita muscaria Koide BX008]|uniref:Uncharacterized protein n=1 Tax=Amanita muscaria (strain Koide BX008) TaxID=946122 RepID=A0A0C2TF35_AMAMK|nr:hypothetical protein M378DRAFT_162086 [Amanita muscaria Koide BX008]
MKRRRQVTKSPNFNPIREYRDKYLIKPYRRFPPLDASDSGAAKVPKQSAIVNFQ